MEEIRDWNTEHFDATTVFHFNHSLRPFICVADIYFVDLHNNEYYTFDDIIRHLEYRTNKVYDIDTSYKKSLEVMKELDKTVKESKELEKDIDTKTKEYKKTCDNEFEL